MSHRPFNRDDDSFEGGSFGGGDGERGGFRKPWQRNDDSGDSGDNDSSEGGAKPWQRRDRDGDRGGFDGRRGGFGGRDRGFGGRDRGFGRDRGGFGGRDRGFGGRRDGFGVGFRRDRDDDGAPSFGGRKPWQRHDEDAADGDSFESRPWQRRDRDGDRGGFGGRDRGFGGRDRGFGHDRGGFGGRDRGFGGDRGGFGGRDRGFGRDRGGFGGRDRGFGHDRGGFGAFGKRDRDEAPIHEEAPKKPRTPVPEGELIYGRQPVREMLRANRRIVKEIIFADGVKQSDEIAEIEKFVVERGISTRRYPRETLDGWLNAANHQGVIAACDGYTYAEFGELLDAMKGAEGNATIILLDHVIDPQNLGSILRSCDAAGVVGVVIPADRAVEVTPAVVRASAGAAEHLKVAIVPSLVTAIEKLKEIPVWVTGLDATENAENYTEIDFSGKVALVIGSEGLGIGKSVGEHCDHIARLPMRGKVESLNAGVAGALVMYEVLRQQGQAAKPGGQSEQGGGKE